MTNLLKPFQKSNITPTDVALRELEKFIAEKERQEKARAEAQAACAVKQKPQPEALGTSHYGFTPGYIPISESKPSTKPVRRSRTLEDIVNGDLIKEDTIIIPNKEKYSLREYSIILPNEILKDKETNPKYPLKQYDIGVSPHYQ